METSSFLTMGEAFQLGETLPLVVFDPYRQKVPVKLWLRELEASAQEQVLGLSQIEVVRGHVAVMPDAHMGIGCSVGTVFATVDAVVPSTVGVDLGCGMIAVRFPGADAERLQTDKALLRRLHGLIREVIPTGAGEHSTARRWEGLGDFPLGGVLLHHHGRETDFERLAETKAAVQLGSLGGGNHFIELCLDEDNAAWFMVHSGSRGIGNLIGGHFMRRARAWCDERGLKRPRDLDWLPVDHPDGALYVSAVHWAQSYARENRHRMLRALRAIVEEHPDISRLLSPRGRGAGFTVENHHNFVQRETHQGEQLWVHRKGAVSAQVGEWGILPGSMATGSYIVQGKGDPQSWCSCAHGSGRKMSRNAAKKMIPLEEVEAAMVGIVGEPAHQVHDEAPQAYKDLGAVMEQQRDLISPVHRLRPLLNVKGY